MNYKQTLHEVSETYRTIVAEAGEPPETANRLMSVFVKLVEEQVRAPHTFEPYHRQITAPFDYYAFGVEFLRPLMDKSRSTFTGREVMQRVATQLAAGENVIFLANHQNEADPQAISILLEDEFPAIGREMIFVAGERVITDPLTVPFSMGRNLLCIFSKRHIDHPPDQKAAKQLHNRRALEQMTQLLSDGGHCIYVAPSGGRDRINKAGVVDVAPFDAQSVEMFHLMAQRATRPTHFYPMALATYHFMPPPDTVQVEIGEPRRISRSPIHMAIAPEIDMHAFDQLDRHERREARAQAAWRAVCEAYARFPADR
ncbi:MAG TPA: 1-acyl-sn-glycerol-3-phosphate acyltransferase [Vicinamibacterales bacterium]|nr:1-acyl-sn-glycerol-3-phosphate acyltransferase [Vicinamibacterales bacterium]